MTLQQYDRKNESQSLVTCDETQVKWLEIFDLSLHLTVISTTCKLVENCQKITLMSNLDFLKCVHQNYVVFQYAYYGGIPHCTEDSE